MANTIPNIKVLPNTVTNIYTDAGVVAAGIVVGDKINVAMLGQGDAQLYAGPTAPAKIDHASGYRDLSANEEMSNDLGDTGAFIYSLNGCVINVKAV
jgi:hypothetical protein